MHEPINIINALNNFSTDDEQLKNYLTASIQKYPEFLINGELPSEEYAQPVTTVQDEDVADALQRLSSPFPFVESFTFAEFHVFSCIVDQHLASRRKGKRGRPKRGSQAQMQTEVQWIAKYYPNARVNALTKKYEYEREPGVWHTMQGKDLEKIYTELGINHGIEIQQKRAMDIFIHIADSNPYEPTLDLINYCRSQYPKMSREQAQSLLFSAGSRLLGQINHEPTVNGQLTRDLFFARFLINMAILARNPGSIPTYIPILIGEQGCGKSQFCRSLIPEKFESLFAPITNTLEQLSREPYRMHVAFLLELPEVDCLMIGKKAPEWMKQMITTPEDSVRYCYHALPTKLTRRFSFIGTTNRQDIFTDGTGQYERRYIPIEIPSGHIIPWELMRDGLSTQLWAAADLLAEDYKDDDRELKSFTEEEAEALTKLQQNYTCNDPWESRLMTFCSMRSEFTPAEALVHLDVPVAQQNRAHIRRVNGLIRKRLGPLAKYVQITRDGQRPWVWRMAKLPSLEQQFQTLADVNINDF